MWRYHLDALHKLKKKKSPYYCCIPSYKAFFQYLFSSPPPRQLRLQTTPLQPGFLTDGYLQFLPLPINFALPRIRLVCPVLV